MGTAEAKLNQDLQIRQVVSDLAACWGDSEKNVLEFLARLTLDGKLTLYTKVRVPIPGHYVKRIDPITQEQIDDTKLATIRRTIPFSAARSEKGLRQAARDGWNAVEPVRDGEREFEFGTLMVNKDKLIDALESEPKPYIYRIPPKWIGNHDAGDLPSSAVGRVATNKKTWDDAKLRALWDESIMPGITHASLGEKYKVSHQRIGTLLSKAKEKFKTKAGWPDVLTGTSARKTKGKY